MRIAFITLGYSPFRTSGLDVSGERLVKALRNLNHEVTVISAVPSRQAVTRSNSSPVIHRLYMGRSNWIGYTTRAARFVEALQQQEQFDIVHFYDIHFAYRYRGKFVATLNHSFRQRIGSLGRFRITDVHRVFYYLAAKYLAEKPALYKASGLLAGSKGSQIEFMKHYGISINKIQLTRHGIDTELFRPSKRGMDLRTRYGIGPSDPVILHVGFITRRKGISYLANAIPQMKPSPWLLMVGQMSSNQRKKMIHDLGKAADKVKFLDYVPDSDLPGLYSLADVYVSSSLLEGFGLPIAEALACETPVIATDVGSVSEVVGDGGILVPPRDPGAMAHEVSRLLIEPSIRRELGELGRNHIRENFSLGSMTKSVLNAYRQFLS